MESPFAKTNTSITMYLEPILNTYNKTYINIITLSNMPDGPLKEMVSRMNPPKLSEYYPISPFIGTNNNCVYTLMRYPGTRSSSNSSHLDFYMYADDIPSVFSYLTENGYIIDTKMTNMMQKSNINIGGPANTRMSGNRKLICMFTYKQLLPI